MTRKLQALWDTLAATGFFSIAGSTIVNRILSFMSGILVVRLLSKADYGVYSYAYNILNIALLFNGIGVASAFIQLCCEPGGKRREVNLERWGFKGGGLFDILLSTGIFLWATFVPEGMPGTRLLLQICALFPIPQFVFDMQTAALRAQLRNSDYATSNVINTVCIVTGSILGAFVAGAVGLLVGRATGVILSVLIVSRRFGVPMLFSGDRNQSDGNPDPLCRRELIDYVRIAISSALANGISSLTYLIGTFMIGQLLADPLEVASYEAASAIPVALNFIPVTIMTYVYPYFAHHKDDLPWVRTNYIRLLSLTLLGFGAVAILCTALAPHFVSLLYGEQDLSSVPSVRVLLFGSWIGASCRIVSGNLLVTQRLVKANLASAIITVAAILQLNWVLVPIAGAFGSAVAQTVGLCISGVFNTMAFSLKIRKK